jgi:2'-5' RNA ligase
MHMTIPTSGSLRLFIAVELSAEARTVLRDTQAQLEHQRLPVRWADADGAHVTLKYLGDVKQQQIEAITVYMHEIGVRHQPFTLQTGALGAFPDLNRTRVVWLAVNGDRAALGRLRDDVEHTIAPLGFPTENRPFAPHLTLGRTHKDVPPQDRAVVGRALGEQAAPNAVAFTVDDLVLFRSDSGPTGTHYTAIKRITLDQGPRRQEEHG